MPAIIECNNYVKDKRLSWTSVVDDVLMKLMRSMIDESTVDVLSVAASAAKIISTYSELVKPYI